MRDLYVAQIQQWQHDTHDAPPHVATLFSTSRPHRLASSLRLLASQQGVILQPIIATHGFSPSKREKDLAKQLGLDVTWLHAPADLTLGEVYNQILTHVTAQYLAKIDDDDYYGEYYLLDSVMQLRSSGAGITGKDCMFVYSQSENKTYIRKQNKHHRFVYGVAGGSIVTTTAVATTLGFARKTIGEDKDFLERAFDQKIKLYASSPFGFALTRGEHNTWQTTDSFLHDSAYVLHSGEPGVFECLTGITPSMNSELS